MESKQEPDTFVNNTLTQAGDLIKKFTDGAADVSNKVINTVTENASNISAENIQKQGEKLIDNAGKALDTTVEMTQGIGKNATNFITNNVETGMSQLGLSDAAGSDAKTISIAETEGEELNRGDDVEEGGEGGEVSDAEEERGEVAASDVEEEAGEGGEVAASDAGEDEGDDRAGDGVLEEKSYDTDDEDSDEDENAFQKLNDYENIDVLNAYHTRLKQENYNTISALTQLTYDKNGVIQDVLHKTLPVLTKYELTKCLSIRTAQLNNGGAAFVPVPPNIIDGYQIAVMELKARKLPFIIKRPMPDGTHEYWKVNDLDHTVHI